MTARRRTRPSTSPSESPDLFALGGDAIDERSVPKPRASRLTAPAAAPGETADSAISVATLTQTIKDILEGAFPPIWVRGEVSDFKQHRNGHWYFTLRGGEASIRCVVW